MALATLPPEEAEYLVSLRADLPLLRARVVQLRDADWPLRAIGAPLGSPRSTVRAWEVEGRRTPAPAEGANLPPVPQPTVRPHPRSSTTARTRALRPDVPAHDRAEIARLAPLARKVRGGTPQSSPLRQAKSQLDDLVLRHSARGVSIQRLAELAGVTYRAMSVRIQAASTSPPPEFVHSSAATSPATGIDAA